MRIASLHIHPLKSCRGVRVDEAEVGARGLEGDRRWMVVDPEGRFLSQRKVPRMSLVSTRLEGERIVVTAPGVGSHRLPLRLEEGPSLSVEVWGDRVEAIEDEEAGAFFSRALGRPCRAVYMPDGSRRPAGSRAPDSTLVSFADAYPLLVISEASLVDLNGRLETPVVMERFRPNIVVEGALPFAEDEWREVRMGELRLRGVKRCDRCVVTTIDPETGVGGKEPLKTLAGYRLEEGKVWFGMNLVALDRGKLNVGDAVLPLESA